MVAKYKPRVRYIPRAVREKLDYMDAGVAGCIVNVAKKNFWKVASWYEFADLLQDGKECYTKCRNRFKPKHSAVVPQPEDRRRFQAYFRRAFENHITDLANERTATPEVAVSELAPEQGSALEALMERAADFGDANLGVLLANAPAEILEMLQALLVDLKAEMPHYKSRLRKKLRPGKVPRIISGRKVIRRDSTEQHYDRCLRKKGVVETLRQYFVGDSEVTERCPPVGRDDRTMKVFVEELVSKLSMI